jgi:hypothetical protein
MKMPNPAAAQIAPQPTATVRPPFPQRRLNAADLADLAPTLPKPAETTARAPAAPAQNDARPVRPGSLLDIKV